MIIKTFKEADSDDIQYNTPDNSRIPLIGSFIKFQVKCMLLSILMREKTISLSNVYYILEENGKLNLILQDLCH